MKFFKIEQRVKVMGPYCNGLIGRVLGLSNVDLFPIEIEPENYNEDNILNYKFSELEEI